MEPPVREYEKAINCIRTMIETGKLKVGDRLPAERDLAAQLGIGRNSTREALRTLENMGVTRSIQGSGNYLSGNMIGNLSGMIDMMLLMQTMAPTEIRRFRSHMEQTVCDMILENPQAQPVLDEIQKVLDIFPSSSSDDKIELDRQFHYLLIQATGNRMLIFLMGAIMDVYRRWITVILQDSDCSDAQLHTAHCAILTGLLKRDPVSIRKAIADHYAIIDRELARESRRNAPNPPMPGH